MCACACMCGMRDLGRQPWGDALEEGRGLFSRPLHPWSEWRRWDGGAGWLLPYLLRAARCEEGREDAEDRLSLACAHVYAYVYAYGDVCAYVYAYVCVYTYVCAEGRLGLACAGRALDEGDAASAEA